MTTIAEKHYNLKSEKSVPVCLRAGKLWGPLLSANYLLIGVEKRIFFLHIFCGN